jgi:hypothetical protein
MRGWLLSYFSPETLSWYGFVVLVAALVGEAGNALIAIITGWEKAQKELALVLAIAAAGAYAIERIGDDAIVQALENRSAAAEGELKRIEGPRNITASEHNILVSCLRAAPHKGVVHIRPGWVNGDARQIAEQLTSIFEEAGGFELKPSPGGDALSWSSPGIFLVVTDLQHAPPHAHEIQQCFWNAGRQIVGYPDASHAPDTVTIGIGSKL